MEKFGRNMKNQRSRGRHLDDDRDGDISGEPSFGYGSRQGRPKLNRGIQSFRDRLAPHSVAGRTRPQGGRGRATSMHKLDASRAMRIHREAEETSWFLVKIPDGSRWEKEVILRELATNCPIPFRAVNFHVSNEFAKFYLNSRRASGEIRRLSGKLPIGSPTKMDIIVEANVLPQVSLTEDAERAIKVAMSNRYNCNTRFLDLSNFEDDPSLADAGLFMPLSRVNVTSYVVTVIVDHIPELEGIDLSYNSIYNTRCLSPLAVKCKQIKTLKLEGNKIRSVRDLDLLKGLPVSEATFAHCPFTDLYKDDDTYVTAVRDRFPRLVLLDQKQLPTPIVFDLEEEKFVVPRSLPSHLPVDAIGQLVIRFVEQFFGVFDSNDRSPLADAYHEASLFSLSSVNLCISRTGRNQERLEYNGGSRNLLRMKHDEAMRRRLLHDGRIKILEYLKSFAKTEHNPSSFVVDVALIEPSQIVFYVNGVFREQRPEGSFLPNLRSFQRMFTAAPRGAGLEIVNDSWFITVATSRQCRVYQNTFPQCGPLSVAPAPVPPSVVADANEEVIVKFMQATKMNRRFSIDCLREQHWNPEAAYNVFRTLEQSKKLPPEAFH